MFKLWQMQEIEGSYDLYTYKAATCSKLVIGAASEFARLRTPSASVVNSCNSWSMMFNSCSLGALLPSRTSVKAKAEGIGVVKDCRDITSHMNPNDLAQYMHMSRESFIYSTIVQPTASSAPNLLFGYSMTMSNCWTKFLQSKCSAGRSKFCAGYTFANHLMPCRTTTGADGRQRATGIVEKCCACFNEEHETDLLAMDKAMSKLPAGAGSKRSRNALYNKLYIRYYKDTGLAHDTNKVPKGDALAWLEEELKKEDKKKLEIAKAIKTPAGSV